MNQGKFNRVVSQLEKYTTDIHNAGMTPLPANVNRLVTLDQGDLGNLTIWDEEVLPYENCIRELVEAVNDRDVVVSERTAENAVQQVILKSLDVINANQNKAFPQRLQESLGDFKKRFTSGPVQWDVYLEVVGVRLQNASFLFGHVRFLPPGPDTMRLLKRSFYSILLANKSISKMAYARLYRKQLQRHFSSGAVAWIQVKAHDAEIARTKAGQILDLALETLNFWSLVVHPRGLRARAYRPGNGTQWVHTFSLSVERNQRFQIDLGSSGSWDFFDLASLSGDQATSTGLTRFSQILRQTKPNAFEERLIAAVRYAGRASTQEIREESFLQHAIALECLLGDKETNEITYKLATRCAHLIGTTPDKRKEIASDIKKLYGVRSKIVHSGRTDMTDLQLSKLRVYVRLALIGVLIGKEFEEIKTVEQWIEWFDSKILA